MNWYKTYKESQTPNTGFQRGMLSILGTGVAMTALIMWYGISSQQASQMIQTQAQQVEQALSQIPNHIIEQAKQTSQPATQQPVQSVTPQQSQGLISQGEVAALIKKHEGLKYEIYPDSEQIPTIGIGFNMQRPDARSRISQIGADYNKIMNGQAVLNNKQVEQLFQICLTEAFQVAQNFVPDLSSHPKPVQKVVIDMAFNLGPQKLGQFVRFQTALKNRNYITAAQEMVHSKWYSDVRDRGPAMVRLMQSAAVQSPQPSPQNPPR